MTGIRETGPDHPISVRELTGAIKRQLTEQFPMVWVAGEVSGLSRPRSGHCYFTLKDDQAQINAILWRSTVARLKFAVENGQEVLCRGAIDVYAQRGTYQLIVDRIQPQGVGALELAFRQLKQKLAAEGLFDADRKRPLPSIPRRVAVVTSPSGAAIRDFLQVLRRRWGAIDLIIIPTPVQGPTAANQIARGIELCARFADPPDVIVVTRGGGSLEDLWSFNEEVVCRAIAASPIPVLSGVGHEVDVTLADLAADVRALTPSEAAERLTPDRGELLSLLETQRIRLTRGLTNRLSRARADLDGLARRTPLARPLEQIQRWESELDQLDNRLQRAISTALERSKADLNQLAAALHSLNPLAVLARGYSLTTTSEGQLLRDSRDLDVGSNIETRLNRGRIVSRVLELEHVPRTEWPTEQSAAPPKGAPPKGAPKKGAPAKGAPPTAD